MPSIITIREAVYDDIPAISQVHVDTWRSTYAGIVPDEVLAGLSYKKRQVAWQQVFENARKVDGFTYVAENELGQVIGFSDGGKERTKRPNYQGELNALYILEGYQRQGFGRELVTVTARRLDSMGIRTMLVWVLEMNPACEFYEALGGQVVQEKEIEIGGKELIEIAYGWRELSTLLHACVKTRKT